MFTTPQLRTETNKLMSQTKVLSGRSQDGVARMNLMDVIVVLDSEAEDVSSAEDVEESEGSDIQDRAERLGVMKLLDLEAEEADDGESSEDEGEDDDGSAGIEVESGEREKVKSKESDWERE